MTYEEFLTQFQISLTPQQLAAVKSVHRPTLLLAVPGSGKTTVLVTRLGYMIHCCEIAPEQILTVTYTVAATKDMQNRFVGIFGEKLAERLEFRTINGICAKIISFYGERVGKQPFTLVTEEGFKMKLLSGIYLNILKEYPTESDLKGISTLITYIKNMQLSTEEIKELEQSVEHSRENAVSHIGEIYQAYCSEMRRQSLMDYDDQMVYAYTMLKKDPEVLSHFQELYRYICVDEAQDTSKIQHNIISLLARRYENLFMVGDEDQSIYGFRAAYPEALLSFEKIHPDGQVLLMEENFRSNALIVSAADGFIQKNEFRHKKRMRAAREEGARIREIPVKNRKAQYQYLAKVAAECERETAVLYRDNESILPLIDLLERQNIPYRMKNADLTFFSHRVVLDIADIIRFAKSPWSTELFLKVYYKIGTYLNKNAAMEACRCSVEQDMDVLDAVLTYVELPAGTKKSVKAMQTHLANLLQERADKALYRIVNFMGYGSYLERMHIKDTKIPILEAIAANEPKAERLLMRLEELAQVIREKEYARDCNLIFSTIHSSKGLEYDTVYLLDVLDGVFPESVVKDRKHATQEELKLYEEERRLFYVGVTRAKNQLLLFRPEAEATFIDELLGREATRPAIPKHVQTGYGDVSGKKTKKRIVTESEYMDKLEEIQTTGYVKHKTYGEGRVESMNGDTILVAFAQKTVKCKLKYMMEQGIIE